MAEETRKDEPTERSARTKRVLSGASAGAAIGATVGLCFGLGKNRTVPKTMASMAANYALAGSLVSGAGVVSSELLQNELDNPINVIIGGFTTGAIFSRLGGSRRPIALGLLFSSAGVTVQFAAKVWEEYRLRRFIKNLPDEAFPEELLEKRRKMLRKEKEPFFKFPNWFPIKVTPKDDQAQQQHQEP